LGVYVRRLLAVLWLGSGLQLELSLMARLTATVGDTLTTLVTP